MLQNLPDLPAIAGSNNRHISDELLDAPLERPSGNYLPRQAGDRLVLDDADHPHFALASLLSQVQAWHIYVLLRR